MKVTTLMDWDQIDRWIEQGLVVEECYGNGPIGLLAYHGGKTEPGTESIVRFVAQRTRARVYILSGRLRKDNYRMLHESSPTYPTERVIFQDWLKGVQLGIAVHGHRKGHKEGDAPSLLREVFVGGGNRKIAESFCQFGRSALPEYQWTSDLKRLRHCKLAGLENNPTNLPSQGGIQIELPRSLRNSLSRWSSPPLGHSLQFAELLCDFVRSLQQSS